MSDMYWMAFLPAVNISQRRTPNDQTSVAKLRCSVDSHISGGMIGKGSLEPDAVVPTLVISVPLLSVLVYLELSPAVSICKFTS